MLEKPLLFSKPMVLAILDDLKTKTRRIVKHRHYDLATADFLRMGAGPNGVAVAIFRVASGEEVSVRCPYGGQGHQLWVRETWSDVNLEGAPALAYQADGHIRDLMEEDEFLEEDGSFNYGGEWMNFGETGLRFSTWSADLISGAEGKWKPSIHMPRWASRLQLRIVSVGVERVQSITDEDGLAEGARHKSLGEIVWAGFMGVPRATCPGRTCFALLWMEINGKEAWDNDPWVWVVEFARVQP